MWNMCLSFTSIDSLTSNSQSCGSWDCCCTWKLPHLFKWTRRTSLKLFLNHVCFKGMYVLNEAAVEAGFHGTGKEAGILARWAGVQGNSCCFGLFALYLNTDLRWSDQKQSTVVILLSWLWAFSSSLLHPNSFWVIVIYWLFYSLHFFSNFHVFTATMIYSHLIKASMWCDCSRRFHLTRK